MFEAGTSSLESHGTSEEDDEDAVGKESREVHHLRRDSGCVSNGLTGEKKKKKKKRKKKLYILQVI